MDLFYDNGIKINTSDTLSSVSMFGNDKETQYNAFITAVNNRLKLEFQK